MLPAARRAYTGPSINRDTGIDVISANSCDVAVLEMGEDECGAGDIADFAGAGGDVLEGAPPLVEQGEPAFAEAAEGALDGVAGAVIDVQFPAAWGLFDRNEDSDARA